MDSKQMARLAVDALADKKAEDIKVLDISLISPIADYFIIANANNQNQLLAMQDAVDEKIVRAGHNGARIEGNRSSTWILMDFGEVIVHLFSTEDRLFYDLERVWKDGQVIDPETL